MEYKVREENGKKIVEAVCEKIEREDGTVDVVVHVPSLQLLSRLGE